MKTKKSGEAAELSPGCPVTSTYFVVVYRIMQLAEEDDAFASPSWQGNQTKSLFPQVQQAVVELEGRNFCLTLTTFKNRYFLVISETGGNFASLVSLFRK